MGQIQMEEAKFFMFFQELRNNPLDFYSCLYYYFMKLVICICHKRENLMSLANCPRCGQLFNQTTNDVCKKCQQIEDDLLRITKEYLRKNPNATAVQTIQDLETQCVFVEKSLLEKWEREHRIRLVKEEENHPALKCPLCGRRVKEGETICITCKFTKLRSAVTKEHSADQNDDSAPRGGSNRIGMHYKRWE
jgi:uncharacterized C2H2 Zn-finger protein